MIKIDVLQHVDKPLSLIAGIALFLKALEDFIGVNREGFHSYTIPFLCMTVNECTKANETHSQLGEEKKPLLVHTTMWMQAEVFQNLNS